MLKKISPLLGPETLATLRIMGHGDKIAIVDGNYPAENHAKRLIRADGLPLIPILEGILDILPIEQKTEAIFRAVNADSPTTPDPIHLQMIEACAKYEHRVVPLAPDLFYSQVQEAFAVIATSEPELYGNIILTKGIIHPTK